MLGDAGAQVKHDIQRKSDAEVTITGLTVETVSDGTAVAGLLAKANGSRAVASTKMNAQSSRSHSIFRLRISGVNPSTGEECDATVNLVDLVLPSSTAL